MNKQSIKTAIADTISRYNHWRGVRIEVKKFQDPRRVKIANEFPLTKEQKEQIDELYLANYGEKIDYVWHQNYAAHAGKFDCRFFPEHIYIPEFEAYQNPNKAMTGVMSDKNILPLIAKSVGVNMPRTIVSCTNGVLRDGENRIISPAMAEDLVKREGMCFAKPSVESSSGRGCVKIEENTFVRFSGNSMDTNLGGQILR